MKSTKVRFSTLRWRMITPVWSGSATQLVALLGEDMQPNILTRRLNVKAGELLNEYGIEYTVKRTRSGSFISLARKAV